MFGYIRACKPELKMKEFETYKAVYCSLCRRLGKSYGMLSRMTLSYDFTFLALLNMSLSDGCVAFEQKRCAFNPLKKCNYCKCDDALELPSAAAMIMLYYKILDNIADEHGFKKLGFIMLKPIFSSAHKKAAKKYPDVESAVADYIMAQSEIEDENSDCLDAAADPTARVMSVILPLCSNDDGQKRVLERLGYCLGRYIYLLDAACDLPNDIKKGSYNVLKAGITGGAAEYAKSRVEPQLYTCINEAAKALELLNIKKFKSILGNIIYLGLEETFKKELNK
ncbi:MAG: DUF5685 family protein [Acutalibacteraceae bacterium]|nr:DUF5685 family protein [Acutalibacteraceae bacterium]